MRKCISAHWGICLNAHSILSIILLLLLLLVVITLVINIKYVRAVRVSPKLILTNLKYEFTEARKASTQ